MSLAALARSLAGRPPRGMSLDDARLAGLVPPIGWTPPPRDRARDAIRTGRVVVAMLAQMASDAGADTTTAEGLARIRTALAMRAKQLGVEVRVSGTERVPATGGLVFMWNQTSHLDHVVLPLAIPRPFHSTYNNEVRRFPIYGARLARTDHFWLDRTNEAQWRTSVAVAAERVAGGACVLISPEGTRSWDGRLLPMKRGAFVLARLARRPIVCVAVRGANALLPRGRLAVRPGIVDIELAEPIPCDDRTTPMLESLVVERFERVLRPT
jgi:1-acyl-sn-glycerol-3-phosphate acyltransferase